MIQQAVFSQNKNVDYNKLTGFYFITIAVPVVPTWTYWDKETIEELNDPSHMLSIKQARDEYKRGDLVSDKTVLAKLRSK